MYNLRVVCLFALFISLILCVPSAQANNLNISNVRLGSRDPQAKTVTVLFDIAWDNSWRNKINHDAAWVTVRLANSQLTSGVKYLCPMNTAGIAPGGFYPGSNSNAEVYVPLDKIGAFIRPQAHQSSGTFSSKSVILTVNYAACGFSESDKIEVSVKGTEMVYVPEGAFYAGDYASSVASFKSGTNDTAPWLISSSGPISVTAAASAGYFYSSSGGAGEYPTGTAFVVPQAFPKGYGAFYVMKYEITEGQWVDFINSIPAGARTARDITNAAHKNADSVIDRNTISCSGSPLTCSTSRPYRAVNYLGWTDYCAFLDWLGLRPITELEYEKSARGPVLPIPGEFAWGSTNVIPVSELSSVQEVGDESVVTNGANAHYGNTTLVGGDSGNGPEYAQGPLRAGIFSTATSTRIQSGAGYYGVMELSGNLKEWAVTVGNPLGLAFTGISGDGYLSTLSGYEGNADVNGWPGMDVVPSRGITSSQGAGFRGGSWGDNGSALQVSDRSEAANGANDAEATYGGRGVRTVDAQ